MRGDCCALLLLGNCGALSIRRGARGAKSVELPPLSPDDASDANRSILFDLDNRFINVVFFFFFLFDFFVFLFFFFDDAAYC